MKVQKNKASILVVDDAPDTLEVLQRNLSSSGYKVYAAPGVAEAIELLEKIRVDLVITDLKMPKISGLDLVRHVRENLTDTEVMMITGYATIGGAVEAVKTGADEYLSKPFTDEELAAAVDRVLGKLHARRLAQERPDHRASSVHGILGKSQAMQEVFLAIEKAATTSATVLISGESGTGKELVGRAIHYSGARSSAPFVPINCGGIPGELVESELFGHVKGAFTGAAASRAGFFQTADGGSIFLDEISETSGSTQVKLLRVLQDKEVYMLGATRPTKVDVRILTATNKNLHSLVEKGSFREDLYFRLSVITINVPPLRERGADVLLLANHFVSKFAREADKPVPEFSSAVLEVLKNYSWPGNVRELENLMQRLVVMKDGPIIEVPDLPPFMRFSVSRERGFNRTLAEVEAEYIKNVLASVKGNKTKAAQILGIDRKTLRDRLKNIESP
ncbi:MAG: response regulator [Candidatus Latescibacteria bacterium]|nr:response regulator [Candidatus Latescibacterota bacterium]NIO28364.1 response regulator [Candidatus Latescibacterota bacterium]NIO55913.1 response regulator [Candidatus Latescibacterota bacterium]NIT01877.1 response regulator [Candidatus Latescibacterota bacterium]